ncbi:MAG: tetratricopeptide repeat protein [Armatimonadota bacterium]
MLKPDSSHVYVFLTVLMLCFPTYRAITRWVLDHLLNWWQFCLLQALTALTLYLLFHEGWNKTMIIVLIIYNVFWLFEPSLRSISRERTLQSHEEIEISRYQHLLTEHPENPVYHTVMGDLYLAQKRYDESIAAYRQAIVLLPEKYRKDEQRKLEEARMARCMTWR